MKKMMILAIMLAGVLSMAQYAPPFPVVIPDSIEVYGPSGSLCYFYSTDCEGTTDDKAVYTWEDAEGIVQQSAAYDNRCIALETDGQLRLTVTGSNGQSSTSNWCYVRVNAAAMHIEEWVQGNVSARFRMYDVHGREVAADRMGWKELPSGMYALIFEDGSAVKMLRP